jgi:hypothetical protein
MARTRPRATRDDVEAAIAEITDYHKQGQLACTLPVGGPGSRQVKTIKDLARRVGCNETKVRKAWQFARRYTGDALDELCRSLRRHRPHFGTAHVGILVTVPDRRTRKELQRGCVREDWSARWLQFQVWNRLGLRRQGGRRPRVDGEAEPLLRRLDALAGTWLRLCDAAGGHRPEVRGGRSVLQKLPGAMKWHVEQVTDAMRELREAVADRLGRKKAKG